MIVYNECGEPAVKITEEEAIRRQKASAAQKGYTYDSDEKALYDFMIVHWAWREDV